jgi:hypothetical protein
MSSGTFQTFTVYPTLGDETWDQVAFKAYGAERFANILIAANPAYKEIVFFDSGMVLIVPQLASPIPVAQMPWNIVYQYS